MEREFSASKGLMGVNGLTDGDMMPDMGRALVPINIDTECNALKGSREGCQQACLEGCMTGCRTDGQNG